MGLGGSYITPTVTQASLQSDFMSCISVAESLRSARTNSHMLLCYTASLLYATITSPTENIFAWKGCLGYYYFMPWLCNGSFQ